MAKKNSDGCLEPLGCLALSLLMIAGIIFGLKSCANFTIRKAGQATEYAQDAIDNRTTRRQVNADLDRMTHAAARIVSDPSSWTASSQAISDLVSSAARAGLDEDPAVQDFKKKAITLMTFSTQWVNTMTRTEQESFSRNMVNIAGEAATESLVRTKRRMSYQHERLRSEASNVISSSLGSLSAADADEFGRLYADLVDSFGKLVIHAEEVRKSHQR